MTPDQAQAAGSLAVWAPVIVALIGGLFGVIKIWSIYLINKNVKDVELAKQLDNAIANSLGTVQQAAAGAIEVELSREVSTAPIPARLMPGVQYVLDHSAEGVQRFEQTWNKSSPEAIADKIASREGLAQIATNLAISGAATPVVAPPLAPIPPTADPPAGTR